MSAFAAAGPSLSASELEKTLRSSWTTATGKSAPQPPTPAASLLPNTQRLLKVLQSKPIVRPEILNPHPHLVSAAPLSASMSSTLHTSPPRFSPGLADREGVFDVLSNFKRELERVRREAQVMAATETKMEQLHAAHLAELRAATEAATASRLRARSSSRSPTRSHSSRPIPPSQAMFSSISNILHSPKLAASALRKPDFGSDDLPLSNRAAPSPTGPFGLAPAAVGSPFASSSSAASAASSDPQLSSVLANTRRVLNSQSANLDAQAAKFEGLLSSLHHWKALAESGLHQSINSLHASHNAQLQKLQETFERERIRLAANLQRDVEDTKRKHQKNVEQKVNEINDQVEREFRRSGVSGTSALDLIVRM